MQDLAVHYEDWTKPINYFPLIYVKTLLTDGNTALYCDENEEENIKRPIYTYLITYLLTYLLHGTEPFLKS